MQGITFPLTPTFPFRRTLLLTQQPTFFILHIPLHALWETCCFNAGHMPDLYRGGAAFIVDNVVFG